MKPRRVWPRITPLLALGLAVLAWLQTPAPALAEETRVKLLAHRGLTLAEPENSLAALRAAVDLGLAGSEVDIRTTRDGRIVLVHDPDLNRTTGRPVRVAEASLAEIRSLPLRNRQGQTTDQVTPTLEEALALVKKHPSFELILDLKAVDALKVARTVLDREVPGQVFFFLAGPEQAGVGRRLKALSPRLRISLDLLCWWKIEGLPRFAVQALGAEALFASEWFFPKGGFAEARQAGAEVQVYLWGEENLPDRFRRAKALGATAVSSDRPDLLLPAVRP